MSVSVEINVGGHGGSQVAKGSEKLLEQLFDGVELSGKIVVRAGQQVTGGPDLGGVQGARIKPAGNRSPRTIVITIQPGDNGTRREFLMDVPNGTDIEDFMRRFRNFVQAYSSAPGDIDEQAGPGAARTVAEIQADLDRLRAEQAGLPATFVEQERVLAQREDEITKREKQTAEDRRKLELDRAGLKQEIGRLNARRRQLEEDIGLTEMELEDAEKVIAQQARGQLEALAASTGMSLDQLLALAQRNGHKS